MKKKLLFLSIGVLAVLGGINAQPPPTGLNGVQINGVNAVAGQLIMLNSVITFNGYTFAIIPIPDTQIDDPFGEQFEQDITSAFITARIVIDANTNGINNFIPNGALPNNGYGTESQANGDAFFGFDIRNYTLQVVPFDFGLSAVLGAGALAAVRTARKRRKEAVVA